MSQVATTVNTITITAGTAQRLINDADSEFRYAKSVTISPFPDDSGIIYVGDEDVSDEVFAAYCSAAGGTAVLLEGDHIFDSRGNENNFIDLYNNWVDGSDSDDKCNVSILR